MFNKNVATKNSKNGNAKDGNSNSPNAPGSPIKSKNPLDSPFKRILARKSTGILKNNKDSESPKKTLNNFANFLKIPISDSGNKKDNSNRSMYASLDTKYDDIFKRLENEFEPKKLEMENKIEKINKEMAVLDSEIKVIKSNLHFLYTKQREYYLDLLQKGIDVRSEGLTWIVQRLIELNYVIDNSIFPRFIDSHQIDYLIFISYKSIEISQMKILMRTLRSKHLKEKAHSKDNKNFLLNNINHNFNNNPSSLDNRLFTSQSQNKPILNSFTKKFNNPKIFFEEGKNQNIAFKSSLKPEMVSQENKVFSSSSGFVNIITANEQGDPKKPKSKNETKNSVKKFPTQKNKIARQDSEDSFEMDHEDAIIEQGHEKNFNNANYINDDKFKEKKKLEIIRKNSCELFLNTFYSGKNSDFYLKSFSEKALLIFDNIFKKYEMLGNSQMEKFQEEKYVNY